MRVLIVEDEPAMAGILRFNFEQEGYNVFLAGDGFEAMDAFEQSHRSASDSTVAGFDCIVLDLMLPGMSGYEICRRIRETDPHIPVLVLSARTLAEDRMVAFDAGTDQYLTKPFDMAELLNRVRNLIDRRRTKAAKAESEDASPAEADVADRFMFPRFELDVARYELRVGEKTYTLTSRELQLMRYFIEHDGQVMSRDQIMEDVWDEPAVLTTRTIDNFVLRLRKYLEADPAKPEHILSVRGAGYRFVADPESA